MRRYDHIGIPTDVPRAGEVYIERYDLYCTDHEGNPFGIQWMRYGPGCPLPKFVKSTTQGAGCGLAIALSVVTANPRARSLYERLGFTVTQVEPPFTRMRHEAHLRADRPRSREPGEG